MSDEASIGREVADVIRVSSVWVGASKAERDAFIADGQRRLNAIGDMVMAAKPLRAADARVGTPEDIDPLGR